MWRKKKKQIENPEIATQQQQKIKQQSKQIKRNRITRAENEHRGKFNREKEPFQFATRGK